MAVIEKGSKGDSLHFILATNLARESGREGNWERAYRDRYSLSNIMGKLSWGGIKRKYE